MAEEVEQGKWAPFKPVAELGEVTKGERTPVIGIPAVQIPCGIRDGEWVCLACGGFIIMNEQVGVTTWNHDAGCAAIAEVAKAVRHAGA